MATEHCALALEGTVNHQRTEARAGGDECVNVDTVSEAAVLPFGGIGTAELILFLVVVLLLMGGKMLPVLGRSLGERARDIVLSVTGRGVSEPGVTREPPPAPGDYFSEAAQGLLGRAGSEATRLGHPYVRPEHFLLALALERDRRTTEVLARFGVGVDQLRRRVLEALAAPKPATHTDGFGDAASTQSVLDRAIQEANVRGDRQIDPVHVLLGLIAEGGAAGEALRGLGVTLSDARAAVARSLTTPP